MTDVQASPALAPHTIADGHLRAGTATGADASDRDALVEQLDSLLERYLNTLDMYEKAQQMLTSILSSANFNNRSGLRYGQDHYDERMQATRTITVAGEESKAAFSVSAPKDAPTTSTVTKDSPSANATEESPTGDSPQESATEPEDPKVNNASSSDRYSSTDPLRWFGILVPPALRQAQSSFVAAVEEPIPEIATLIKDLRKQEIDIGRLRKQLKKL
ncbi:hypothetical protein BDV96DRAFT_604608 [Lophiotrema nucula]|uniref:Vacuolar ATPase assembly protein VMA22 n=1 Tax=Lophiotrema nucula TaxID=690887 RepID=A0A6A5YSL9_9PLEO|nr:hypothetical protein BDV96DRAFT_604608 [Lophiotrema nucula]